MNKKTLIGLFAFLQLLVVQWRKLLNLHQSEIQQHAIMNLWHVNLVLKCLQIT